MKHKQRQRKEISVKKTFVVKLVMVIIVNWKYGEEGKESNNARQHVREIQSVFVELGFTVFVYRNLTKEKMKDRMESFGMVQTGPVFFMYMGRGQNLDNGKIKIECVDNQTCELNPFW
eukprot:UN26543